MADQYVSVPLTLSDLWPGFQGHGILTSRISRRWCESIQLYKAVALPKKNLGSSLNFFC